MSSFVVCGLKLTHDGAVAVIDGGSLRFCLEVEKVDNRPRYSDLSDLTMLDELLSREGMGLPDMDAVAVDGWAQFTDGATEVDVVRDARRSRIPVAGYDERRDPRAHGSPLYAAAGALPEPDGDRPYRSYPHATGHLFSAFCTSPFAPAGRPSLVLVWDGGMPASLYLADPERRQVRALGVVLDITGALYPTFAATLPEFALPENSHAEAYLPVSGKAMAYTGLGRVDEAAVAECASLFERYGNSLHRSAGAHWSREVVAGLRQRGLSNADLIAAMQEFLCRALLDGLRRRLADLGIDDLPLCFAGGCALNIKWNAALRASGLFTEVWVPPFPNDSGSAIGAACAEMVACGGPWALEWDVFRGPRLGVTADPLPGWQAEPATVADVARLLHETGEPIVVLAGRAELGPRALGHRSILACATDAGMRERLNVAKQREWYRPVAPACLADEAQKIFAPGGPDPYMLFDHTVRPQWREAIPAVLHVDDSARLQTVDAAGNPLLAELLQAYQRHSGMPVLCNTSANHKGCGFFPDAASAMRWGGTGYVWCDGVLYRRTGAPDVGRAAAG